MYSFLNFFNVKGQSMYRTDSDKFPSDYYMLIGYLTCRLQNDVSRTLKQFGENFEMLLITLM